MQRREFIAAAGTAAAVASATQVFAQATTGGGMEDMHPRFTRLSRKPASNASRPATTASGIVSACFR